MINGIYNPKEMKKEYFYRLLENSDGEYIDFCVVDEAGNVAEGGRLFGLRKTNGNIRRYPGASKEWGFEIESDGKVKIY